MDNNARTQTYAQVNNHTIFSEAMETTTTARKIDLKCWCNCNKYCWCPCHKSNKKTDRVFKKAKLSPRSETDETEELIFLTPHNSDDSVASRTSNNVMNRKRNLSTTGESWGGKNLSQNIPTIVINESDSSHDISNNFSSLNLQVAGRHEKFNAEAELPRATLEIWRQARNSKTNQSKARVRSSYLRKLADLDTLPLWTVSMSKVPQFIEPFIDDIVELKRHQAQETLRMLAAKLHERSELEETKARGYLHTVQHLLKNNTTFARSEEHIGIITTKDRQHTTSIMEKLEKRLESERVTNDLIKHMILNPPEDPVIQTAPPTNQSEGARATTSHAPIENMNEPAANQNTPRDNSQTRDWPARQNQTYVSKGRGQRPASSRFNGPQPKRGQGRARSRSPLTSGNNRQENRGNNRSEPMKLSAKERELIMLYRK